MNNELHLTRQDFEVMWFSGPGGGGQNRNKHDTCCRITHKETGISAQCTAHRDRLSNRRDAFHVLAARILDYFDGQDAPGRCSDSDVARTYNANRKEVVDNASGKRAAYKRVVLDCNIGELIEARRTAMTA